MKKPHHKKRKFRTRKFLKLSFTYFVLFIAIFGIIDYYALMEFNFLWFIAASAILGAGLGYTHVKKGRHDRIDDIANELL
jgi:hypothetical protein